MHHQRGDAGFDAVEQAGDGRQVSIGHVDPRQADENPERGKHKQYARDDATPGAVQQPADIDGQLLRLRTG